MTPDDQLTVTLSRSDWETVTGGLYRAEADADHAATLPDYEPDESVQLQQDARDFARIAGTIEETIR